VILTLRADFYDRPLLYPEVGELMRRGTELVLPLSNQELEQAIVRPAARAGVTLEPVLLATMIKDVGDQPGVLPLLQHALTELFTQRNGRQMTLAGYQASGGILGALGRRAEEIYSTFTPAEQELARQVLLRLVTLGEGVEDTRRRGRQSELAGLGPAQALGAVLDGFGQYRLLTFDRDPITREPTVEVAHEALLRTWGRLREWLDSSRANLRVQRQLAAEAAEWARAGQEASYLASGTRLVQFEALAAGGDVALTDEERAYLAASVAERERQTAAEQERQARELALARQSAEAAQQAAAAAQRASAAQRSAANRLRGFVGTLIVFLLVAAGLAAFAFGQQGEAVAQSQKAQNSAATAVANGAEANAQRATAVANGAEANAQRATAVANGAEVQRQQGLALVAAATAQADSTHANALRLAAEAKSLMLTGGQSELAGLLSLRSMQLKYTVEGDAALEGAAQLDYPVRRFVGPGEDQDPGVQIVTLSPDGKTLYTQTGLSTRLWDFATGRQVANIDFGGDIVSWAPDSKHLLATHDDGTLYIWDTTAMTYTQSPITQTAALWGAVYSPDGRHILSGSASGTDRTTQVWDAATGRQVQVFHGSGQFAYGLAWSPDGRYVVTGARDNIARMWDVQTGLLVHTF
jgi:hypothetical protein